MPTYEFKCKNCGKPFSLVMSITEFSEKKRFKCPHCKSQKIQRVYSGFTAVTSKKS